MGGKGFFDRVVQDKGGFLQGLLDLLEKYDIPYCAIGGFAVNAYCEPLISLDLSLVILVEKLGTILPELKKRYSVTEYTYSIKLSTARAALRVKVQTHPRYLGFIKRSVRKDILGYSMPVAAAEDVLKGKIWSAMDEKMRPASKRVKDMADILRLVEAREDLVALLPGDLKKKLFPEM